MRIQLFLRNAVRGAIWSFCLIAIGQFAAAQSEKSEATAGRPMPDLRMFLPADATLTQQVAIDFGKECNLGGVPGCVAIAYRMRDGEGVRILTHNKAGAWKIAEERVEPGEPGQDELTLQKVTAASGAEALVVVVTHSGAGTSTNWYLIAETADRRFIIHSPGTIRERVLKKMGLVFMGYNHVTVKNDSIIETISGYSNRAPACCPDKPAVEVRFAFTGTSIALDPQLQKLLHAR
jgi:hypothetical protein